MKFIYDNITNLLLVLIVVLLALIWHRMPPTLGEITAEKGTNKKAMMLKEPVVRAIID